MDLEKNDNNQLGPNLNARRKREGRVFSKTLGFMSSLKNMFKFKRLKRHNACHFHFEEPVIVSDPFNRLFRQSIVIGVALLIVTSIAPSHVLETGFTADAFVEDSDFLEEEDSVNLDPLIIDEEGFILKTSPISEDVSRIGLTDVVQHTVVSGDTLSGIAALYGVSVKTLLWENNLSENATLKIGQSLTIPSVDGVSVVVSSDKQTLSGLAKEYGVDVNLIKEHNKLASDTIQKGQKLFIPGGKKKEQAIAARNGTRSSGSYSRNTFDTKIVMSSDSTPKEGKKLIFPTTGKQTQGFRGGHYGLDISNPSKPDIWASAAGTIVVASGGCLPRDVKADRRCGGGYGNYVVIDHGDGLQTLYGHMETLYVVEGQRVETGQALGRMGNTGRVYGATGIHVHFEVYDNGVKRNPWNYM